MMPESSILVVDDDAQSLSYLTSRLQSHGYKVRPADSGELALASIRSQAPALILLDIRMPGMDGFEVCRQLKAQAQTRDLPIIFLTASTDASARVEGLRLGAVDFLLKPIHEEELVARVRTHLELHQLRMRDQMGTRELAEIQERLNATFKKLEALWSLSTMGDADVKAISDHILETLATMTGSAYGFYGFVNGDESVMTIHSWSGEAMKDCQLVAKPQEFPICSSGVWAEAIRKREPLILNDYALSHPAKKGLPEGHVALQNLLVVPFIHKGRMSSVAAVANRKTPFGQEDIHQIQGFLASVELLMERKRMEEELRESLEKYRTLAENMDDVIWILDTATRRFLYVSPSVQKLRGYTPEEVMDQPLEAVLMPDVAEDLLALLAHYSEEVLAGRLKADQSFIHEVEQSCKDGSTVWTELVTHYTLNQSTGRVQLHGVTRNISERKESQKRQLEMERQMLHSQKLESLGILAGGIAHDFNNLLMAILGNLDIALLELSPLSLARPFLEEALQASRRATDLTRQMLAYSGKGHFRVQKLDLNALVQENAHLFRAAIPKLIQMDHKLWPQPLLIQADPGQVQQVIMNLITNGAEAIQGVGFLQISTHLAHFTAEELEASRLPEKPESGAFACLEVSDDGCGMNVETLSRLFDPFFTTKFTGRGLGMAALLGIMKGHKGAIFIESQPGQGTRVQILFPAVESAGGIEAPQEITTVCKSETHPISVLLVDDEASVLRTAQVYLERMGYRVWTAMDGGQALRIFEAHQEEIDLAILDVSMPGKDGIATLHELRRLRPKLPVMLCSGYTEMEFHSRLKDMTGITFLQKPYDLNQVRQSLENALKETKNQVIPPSA